MASVVEQEPFNEYTGNGVATVYPYEFHLLDAGDLVATIDGAPTSAFSLSGVGVQSGGSVTFNTAPANGAKVLLRRKVALARDTDYQYGGDLLESTLDRDFNRIWQAMQDQSSLFRGVVRVPYPMQIPDLPLPRQNAVLGWQGGALVNFDAPTLSGAAVSPAIIDMTAAYERGSVGAAMQITVSPSQAPWFATGSGTLADTARIQACLNWAAGRARVLIDGTYLLGTTLRLPSNTHLTGLGDISKLQMLGTVGGNVGPIQLGAVGDRRTNIRIERLWVDYNDARWGVADETLAAGLEGERCIAVSNAAYVWITDCKITGGRSHCIDVMAPGTPSTGAETYMADGSRYVWIERNRCSGWGDDAITTHHSSDIWIENNLMRDPSGTVGTTGGIELDDGSRNIFIAGNSVYGCESAYALKGHGAPAAGPGPYGVQMYRNRAVNCCQGLMLRQSGSGGVDPSLQDYQDDATTGFSRTAMGVIVDGLEIIAPRRMNVGYTQPVGGMDIQAYTNVLLDNIIISDGTEDLTNKDWLAAGTINADALVKMYSGARRIHFGKITINGFGAASYGIRATGTAGGSDGRLQVHIGQLVVRDGPKFPLYFASGDAKDVYLYGYDISGRHSADGGVGIYLAVDQSSDNAHVYVGPGRVAGYQTHAEISGRQYSANVMHMPAEVRSWGRVSVMGDGADPVMLSRFAAQPVSGIAGYVTRPNSDNERDCYMMENLAGESIGGLKSAGTRVRFYPSAAGYITGGNGTPEGAVSAPVGTVFVRHDGGTGTTIYRKATGTGNTGWVAIA